MKILSFSAVEILPALLDKTKTQTIRPLFDIVHKANLTKETIDKIHKIEKYLGCESYKRREPRFKVGEKVKLYWKQRSHYKEFCQKCGSGIGHGVDDYCIGKCSVWDNLNAFSKIIGEAEITEVFEIITDIGSDAPLIRGYRLQDTYDLAKKDGFDAGENGKYLSFYNYFNRKYDLFSPKRFAVYRWNWL